MIGGIISHYRIIEELGQGGMGVVYKAEDLRLKRIVALKFLPERLSAHTEARGRFEQEAQSASSLNHPNIATIHEIDETDGRIFIVMEYVDGVTLRTWVRMRVAAQDTTHRPIAKEATDLAIQIADALGAAHEKGIVHRDVKSDNIMVTRDGRVKLMDFGLAKLQGVSTLTKIGSTVGTIAYMSPEQAEGLETDHRTDVYSFGVVLYEMLSGTLPFQAPHEAGLIYEIMNVEPRSLSAIHPGVDSDLDRVVMKCLEKDREVRYQSMRDVLVDLKRYRRDSEGKRMDRKPLQGITGSSTTAPPLPSSAAGDIVLFPSPVRPRGRRTAAMWLGAGALFLALVAVLYFTLVKEEAVDSIAVLPFVNVGGEPSDEYLTDGLTESIINNLTKLSRLRVVPRSTVFHYKTADADPQTIGEQLRVHAVLVGRVRQRGDDLSVHAELIDVDENVQLWGEQYSARLSDAQSLQGTISRQIAERLNIRLTSSEAEALATTPTESAEAYRLYLQGRFYWNKRREEDLVRAVECFTQAINKDPKFALAYAGLASTYVVMPEYSWSPNRDFHAKSEAAVQRALALDPSIAEAYAVEGLLLMGHDWKGAEEKFKQAIRLNPSHPTTYHWYQICLRLTKRFDEARAAITRAQELDPLSLIIATNSGELYYFTKQNASAYHEFNKVLTMDPDFISARHGIGLLHVLEGRNEEALREFKEVRRSAGQTPAGLAVLGYAHALQGEKSEARKMLDTLQDYAGRGRSVAYDIALVYHGLGDRDNAFRWLEKSFEADEVNTPYIGIDPVWSSLRSDPRFGQLLRRMQLPE